MIQVIIIAEGQTEETFVRDVMAPALVASSIFLTTRLVKVAGGGRGGALSYERVWKFLRNTLRECASTYVSTFFDLHKLDTAFPAHAGSLKISDSGRRAGHLEGAFHADVIARTGCRPDRFIPHIQPWEFEALLFSDLAALTGTETSWARHLPALQKIRSGFAHPEQINGGQATKPSARLGLLRNPGFHKVRHGPLAAGRIGLQRIEAECPHFAAWLQRLRTLAPL
ncbi:MAG: DUF4276 family protein [Lysobacterales bacterium]|nr:MAG: DUF4276 family protein [Xanthomonadales bacterium]